MFIFKKRYKFNLDFELEFARTVRKQIRGGHTTRLKTLRCNVQIELYCKNE